MRSIATRSAATRSAATRSVVTRSVATRAIGLAFGLGAATAPATGSAAATVGASGQVDPYLFSEVREAIERASEAETDPHRGTDNALEILRGRRAEVAADARLAQALDLRIAGTVIRAHFLSKTKVPPAHRWAQALSTFSRLDLTEPGLVTWIQKAGSEKAAAVASGTTTKKRSIKPPTTPPIKAVILTRGTHLVRAALERQLEAAFASSGVRVNFVPAAEADFVLKLSAEDAAPRNGGRSTDQANTASDSDSDSDSDANPSSVSGSGSAVASSRSTAQRYVRVTLDIERIEGGRLRWRHSVFRTSAASRLDVAVDAGVDWVLRIGGRDVLFRWLGETTFPELLAYGTGQTGPASPPHERPHGPASPGIHAVGQPTDRLLRVTLPKPAPKPQTTKPQKAGPTSAPRPR
ncbi:MAG: hypothetical protein IPK13_12195 [Deltaproteobacteria bacterium]|nr:hypothetical protein [Deltaproteobacteria bacterium]